jgi:hypothetical protein
MEFIKADGGVLLAGGREILLRGFGLGGWLLPEGYMWKLGNACDRPRRMERLIADLCGPDYATGFWREYFDRYIVEEDIELIARQGFNSVRLAINARHVHEMIPRIDRLLDWCRNRGLYAVLDMHGAPGGQTGQNIDDSENDVPELFLQERYRDELVALWQEIALRYRDDPVVAGYDLLNEPLPNWQKQYNPMLVPLYDRLIRAIREVDDKHCVIVEGAHWATDFSVFDEWTPLDGNIMLQFHKYWSPPEEESIRNYIESAKRLNLPLYMGEGGENSLAWYTAAFPMYERLGISWNFWSYKKMDNKNSPISFPVPEGWQNLIAYLDGGGCPSKAEAIEVFDHFLAALTDRTVNTPVFHALKRQPPFVLPCEFYDDYHVTGPRKPGAILRMDDTVNLQFTSGHIGVPDYKRHGGAAQSENVVAVLNAGEWLDYSFMTEGEPVRLVITAEPTDKVRAEIDGQEVGTLPVTLAAGRHTLRLSCKESAVTLDTVEFV